MESIQDCINALKSLLENVYLDDQTLSDFEPLTGKKAYTEEDRVKEVIQFLENLSNSATAKTNSD